MGPSFSPMDEQCRKLAKRQGNQEWESPSAMAKKARLEQVPVAGYWEVKLHGGSMKLELRKPLFGRAIHV